MNALGRAQLIELRHSTGQMVKAWDLRPFGGDPLQLGLTTSPLPPAGSTVDRSLSSGRVLRIDTSTGDVWEITPAQAVAEPPVIGPPMGPPPPPRSPLRNPMVMAVLAGAAWAWWRKRRRA